jgi:signal transduction histidine kinase
MNNVIKPGPREKNRLISNPHFWLICFTLIVICLLYLIYYYTKIDLIGNWRHWFWYIEILEFRYDIHGSLFYIPLLYAAFIFGWRGILITWLSSMVVILPHIVDYAPDTPSLLTNVIILSVPLLVVAFIAVELRWREKEKTTLVERESERQAYMSQIFKAQEDERQRIAQELHDDTTQTLLVIANRAQALVSDESTEIASQTKRQAEWIRDAVIQVSEDMRRLSLDLRPSVLSDMGLVPALRWLVDRLNQEDSIDTKMLVDGELRKLNAETEVMIFRIVQEALNNIRRHAHATEAVLALEFTTDTVKITVRDNGKGFTMPKTTGYFTSKGRLGIIDMQQRAKFLNGTFNIRSEIGKGTSVSIDIRT